MFTVKNRTSQKAVAVQICLKPTSEVSRKHAIYTQPRKKGTWALRPVNALEAYAAAWSHVKQICACAKPCTD